MSRLLQCYDAGNGAQLLWIDAQDYAAQLLCGGTPPWTDAAAALAHLNKVQGLIRSDVVTLPVNAIIVAWLEQHADLRAAIAAKTRLLSPLKALLSDAALRTHLNQIAQGLRASHRELPLVLSVPSPRRWPALAYAQAFPDTTPPAVEADDADAASVYIADFLRGFVISRSMVCCCTSQPTAWHPAMTIWPAIAPLPIWPGITAGRWCCNNRIPAITTRHRSTLC